MKATAKVREGWTRKTATAEPEVDARTTAINGLIRNYFALLEIIRDWQTLIADRSGGGFARELEHTSGLFVAAAEAYVLEEILRGVWAGEAKGEPVSLERIVEYATEQALRGAGSPSRSTSALANLTYQERTAAWAKIAERAKWGW